MPSTKELEAELAAARKDIAALTAMASEKTAARTNGLKDGISAYLGDLSDEARAMFETAQAEGAKARAAAEGRIRDNPLAATAMAFAAGAVVTALLARRR